MSQQPIVDASKTIISHEDEGVRPPPKLEVGLVGWMRQNLFGSPSDVVVTIVSSALLILLLVLGFFNWSVGTANWFTIINNQRLFMMLNPSSLFLNGASRLTVLISALLTGISLAAWARRALRLLVGGCCAGRVFVLLALLPRMIESDYSAAQLVFHSRQCRCASTAPPASDPQRDLAFIAQAGETVSDSSGAGRSRRYSGLERAWPAFPTGRRTRWRMQPATALTSKPRPAPPFDQMQQRGINRKP